MTVPFKKRLRDLRETRGLTQAELATKATMAPLMISHFETGRRAAPSIENLVKLAEALAVSVDYLLGRTDDPTLKGSEVEAAFRSGQWEKTEQRLQFLEDLWATWEKRDQEEGKGGEGS